MQAWVKKLQEKGFCVPWYTQERIDNGRSDLDATLYLPEEKSDKTLRMCFDFERPMDFEYYAEEPNPAFEITKRGEGDEEEWYIEYNFGVSLGQMKNQLESEGSFDALGVKAEDLSGHPRRQKGEHQCRCYRTFSGKEMTAEQLKADKVRSYMVEKDGKKFMMMAMTDDRIGDFGCHIDYRFMISNR